MRKCSVEGCEKPYERIGYCAMHRARFLAHGDPNVVLKNKRNTIDNFWSVVEKTDGCWLFSGPLKETGYGRFSYKDKSYQAHRLSWEINNGTIPNGLHVLHKCDIRNCVNPDHLFLGTHADNMRDMAEKGRSVFTKHRAKLTAEQVIEIREKYKTGNYTHRSLAKEYGMSKPCITLILIGKNWRDLL